MEVPYIGIGSSALRVERECSHEGPSPWPTSRSTQCDLSRSVDEPSHQGDEVVAKAPGYDHGLSRGNGTVKIPSHRAPRRMLFGHARCRRQGCDLTSAAVAMMAEHDDLERRILQRAIWLRPRQPLLQTDISQRISIGRAIALMSIVGLGASFFVIGTVMDPPSPRASQSWHQSRRAHEVDKGGYSHQ